MSDPYALPIISFTSSASSSMSLMSASAESNTQEKSLVCQHARGFALHARAHLYGLSPLFLNAASPARCSLALHLLGSFLRFMRAVCVR